MTKLPLRGVFATIFALMLAAPPMRAQMPTMADVDRSHAAPAAGPLPEWDVAIVKPHPADDHMMSWRMTDDGASLVNLPLELMLSSAWDLKPYQISGLTGWMTSATFDLNAKVSGDDVAAYKKLSGAQRRQMLQKLLIERFQLKVHSETKTGPTYDLVVDKSGSKLKPTTAVDPPSSEERQAHPEKYTKGRMMMGPGSFEGTGVEVRGLASQLSNTLGKPVHDATGLTGAYDITLHFRPEENGTPAGENTDAPSVFTAVQDQLGLKLVPSKGPIEKLVVDSAQKPEAN